jgi:hypothetical protein
MEFPPLPNSPEPYLPQSTYIRESFNSIHEWLNKANFPGDYFNQPPGTPLIPRLVNEWLANRVKINYQYVKSEDKFYQIDKTICKRVMEVINSKYTKYEIDYEQLIKALESLILYDKFTPVPLFVRIADIVQESYKIDREAANEITSIILKLRPDFQECVKW